MMARTFALGMIANFIFFMLFRMWMERNYAPDTLLVSAAVLTLTALVLSAILEEGLDGPEKRGLVLLMVVIIGITGGTSIFVARPYDGVAWGFLFLVLGASAAGGLYRLAKMAWVALSPHLVRAIPDQGPKRS